MDEVDLFEFNEEFAVEVILCIRELNIDERKVNISGGGIALGHPIGATGANIVVSLVYNLQRSMKNKGVAAVCSGGGCSVAMAIEKVNVNIGGCGDMGIGEYPFFLDSSQFVFPPDFFTNML